MYFRKTSKSFKEGCRKSWSAGSTHIENWAPLTMRRHPSFTSDDRGSVKTIYITLRNTGHAPELKLLHVVWSRCLLGQTLDPHRNKELKATRMRSMYTISAPSHLTPLSSKYTLLFTRKKLKNTTARGRVPEILVEI